MKSHLFTGTGQVVRLLFRQHRLKILFWLTGIIGATLATALAYPEVYLTQEDILGFAVTMQNPAMVAMVGPAYPLEGYTIARILAAELLLFTAIAVAVMNILLVSSSTRLDEEEGRLEMIRALPVGRLAYLSASLLMMVTVNGAVFALTGSGLALLGHESMTTEGSFLYGTVLAATGLFFAGVTALSAQLAESSRGTTGLSLGLLLLAYAVRAVGDVQSETLSLLSPLGWTVRTKVFYENDWWPIGALVSGAVLFSLAAVYLNKKRDMMAGILPSRKGKSEASGFLKTVPGLVWRLEKHSLFSWAAGIFLISLASGSVLGDFEMYFSDMEFIQQMVAGETYPDTLLDQFIALITGVLSVFAVAPAVSTVLRTIKEEQLQRMEHFYSRSVSRNTVLGSYLAFALFTSLVMQAAIGIGLYLSADQVVEESLSWGTFLGAAFVYLPAIWSVLGLTVLLIGWIPKGAKLVWAYVFFMFTVLYLENLLGFPEWANNLSAFYRTPQLPYEPMSWSAVRLLNGTAILLTAAGFIGYNKRDIQG